jgi:hypothetical protein
MQANASGTNQRFKGALLKHVIEKIGNWRIVAQRCRASNRQFPSAEELSGD